ncbi:winged helix-turn-helix domain-containing protein [uncultured Arthrobacter sp.]|uniref:response regulator transcription factor n=1 Tax=uncultured Arthrobacter sp. TaxID=114050 RepID=UPI003216BDB5
MPDHASSHRGPDSQRQVRPAPFWEEAQPIVLIAEPDLQAPAALINFCIGKGIRTRSVRSGAAALIAYGRAAPDLVVVSDLIGDIPWTTVVTAISDEGLTPVVLLAGALGDSLGAGAVTEIAVGYDRVIETTAMRALVNRAQSHSLPEPELSYGALIMRPAKFEVVADGHPVRLTLREFELLRILIAHEGNVVPLEILKSNVWGVIGETVTTGTLAVHMGRLRSKLSGTVRVVAVRGVGYRLK